MKNRLSLRFLFLLSLIFSSIFAQFDPSQSVGTPPTSSFINFGHRSSAFKFAPRSIFNISSPSLTFDVDGTIVKNRNASFVGNPFHFNDGILESDGLQVQLTAVFDPAGILDTIWLVGGSSFDAEPGKVIQDFYVAGADNRLEGQPLFDNTIQFSQRALLKELEAGAKKDHGDWAYSVAWSPDGRYLAVGGDNVPAVIVYEWDGSTLDPKDSENHDSSRALSVAWSPDGTYLAVGWDNGTVIVYEWYGSTLNFKGSENHGSRARSVAWSPDGTYLAVGGQYGTTDVIVYEWDGSTLNFKDSKNHGDEAYSVAWSPDGRYLAVGGANGTTDVIVYEWDGSSLGASPIDSVDYGSVVFSVAWSPDGRYLAIGGFGPLSGDELQIYSFDGSSLSASPIDSAHYSTQVSSAAWSPNGKYIASVGSNVPNDVVIYKWDGSELAGLGPDSRKSHSGWAYSVAWSPNGRYLAVGGNNGYQDVIVYESLIYASLNVEMQSKLNQHINMNSGYLILDDDFKLMDNIFLIGPGTINLNGRQLSLGGYYDNSWNTSLDFQNAYDLILNGKTILQKTQWGFNGVSVLNGNGNVFDLRDNGDIYVAPGSTLYISDIYIKGLGNGPGYGRIIFGDKYSQVVTYNAMFELVDDYDILQGKFTVEGETTFVLRDKNWTFNGDSLLTVDGTTLWLDQGESWSELSGGMLYTPCAIFSGGMYSASGMEHNLLAEGNLALLNGGIIRLICSCGFSETDSGFIDEPIHICGEPGDPCGYDYIDEDGQKVFIWDGNGAVKVFAERPYPLIVVCPGYTLRLQNIVFDRINQNTIDLRVAWNYPRTVVPCPLLEGRIEIGENVSWGLSEDITFSQGLIILRGHSVPGDPTAVGEPIIFTVKGVDGKRRLNFDPSDGYRSRIECYTGVNHPRIPLTNVRRLNRSEGAVKTEPILMELRQNEMDLNFINLAGIEHISQEFGLIYAGAIGLAGGSEVDVGDIDNILPGLFNEKGDPEQIAGKILAKVETYQKVFVVNGLDNKLRILKNMIKFAGQLGFGGRGENVLHIDFHLSDPASYFLYDQVSKMWIRQDISNLAVIFGTNFLDLTSRDPFYPSESGMARLIFDDHIVSIINEPDAFWAHENAYLSGQRINIGHKLVLKREGVTEVFFPSDSIHDDYDPASQGKPFVMDVEELVGINGIIPWVSIFPVRSMFESELYRSMVKSTGRRYKTAHDLAYQKQREKEIAGHRPSSTSLTQNRPKPEPRSQISVSPAVSPSGRRARRSFTELLEDEDLQQLDQLDTQEALKDIQGLEDMQDIEKSSDFLTRVIVEPAGGEKIDNHVPGTIKDMSDASGNHKLDHTTFTNFGISLTGGLNLTLNSKSILEVRSDVEFVRLKAGDVINVIGKGNEIYVSKILYIDGGLHFDLNSQLKIVLATDDARVVFVQDSVIDLESNVEWTIEGNGVVEFSDGSIVNMKGSRVTPALWPSLILKDRAKITPAQGATVTIKGVGKLITSDSAKFSAQATSANTVWIIGNTTNDKIEVDVLGTGMIELSGNGSSYGRMSFQKGASRLRVNRSGILFIDNKGLLEINSNNGVLAQGDFEEFILGPESYLYLLTGGTLSFANNRRVHYNIKMDWDSRMAHIQGEGFWRHVGQNATETFTAKMVTPSSVQQFQTLQIPMLDLIRYFVNRETSLTRAIQYLDENGTKKLILRNPTTGGITANVVVVAGDVLSSEDANGNVGGTTSTGKPVIYHVNGVRTVY